MATTDTKSGFRLPWSSDRSHEEEPAADDAPTPEVEAGAPAPTPEKDWPESELETRLGFTLATQRPRQSAEGDPMSDVATEPPPDAGTETTERPAEAAPALRTRKPSKLMADLTAAMRSTAEASRDQSLAQVEGEATAVVDAIREHSTGGQAALRHRSEEDIAAIREWSKAEIARIREETDTRISTRKALLEGELAQHAASVARRIDAVQATVAAYEGEMATFFERLLGETDPAHFAALAESLPEPPTLEIFEDADESLADAGPEAEILAVDPVSDDREVVAQVEATIDDAPAAVGDDTVGSAEPDTESTETEAIATIDEPAEAAEAEVVVRDAGTVDDGGAAVPAAGVWTSEEGSWHQSGTQDAPTGEGDGVARWSDAGDGSAPSGDIDPETGEPVDRGTIMAALEAAAEAVVAAEAAQESANQAEAAADVAETAAELLVGRVGEDDEELDPEAAAVLEARMEGFEAQDSFTDRLAKLLPGHADADPDAEPHVTQVTVAGLVSVASIASFKRHMGRIAGVTAVSVSSGPDSEFVFSVTHRPEVSFREVIPSLPGFGARITGTSDGHVLVTARDPESEG